jgi:hypothetical protein
MAMCRIAFDDRVEANDTFEVAIDDGCTGRLQRLFPTVRGLPCHLRRCFATA